MPKNFVGNLFFLSVSYNVNGVMDGAGKITLFCVDPFVSCPFGSDF